MGLIQFSHFSIQKYGFALIIAIGENAVFSHFSGYQAVKFTLLFCIKVTVKIDDGWSGYDFDRPQFQSMMKSAKNGEINCIIVKDFSRLGRNFQKTEEYLQRIFPKLGIRFISVMDCYDNGRELSATEWLITPLINLANEFTVMETSQKIRSVLEAKRQNGSFVGNHAPYGYLIEDKHLIVDEEVSDVVRKIFELKIEGLSNQGIAEYLNSCGIDSPLEHRITSGSAAVGKAHRKGDTALWSSSSVRRVLENPIYVGTLIQGKTTSISYRNRKRFKRDPSELTAFENAHEAIISDTTFLVIQDLLQRDSYSCLKKGSYLFSGFAFCGNCGQQMVHRENGQWRCRNKDCTCKAIIKEDVLAGAVFRTLKQHMAVVLNQVDYLPATADSETEMSVSEQELKKLETLILDTQDSQKRLLTQKENGVVSQADYEEMMAFYDSKIKKVQHQIEQIQHKKSQILNCLDEIREQYQSYAEFSELTRKILVTFVEKVEVFSKTKIRIYFRYADFFRGDKSGS